MTTFGIVDEGRKTVFTIEAPSAGEAIAAFKRAGYNGWVYQVSPLVTVKIPYFSKAAEIAKKGRE